MNTDGFSQLPEFLDGLLFDLEEFLCEDEPGLIDHELLRVKVSNHNQVASVNAEYLEKVASSEQAEKEGDWETYIFLRIRPYRFSVFDEIKDKLSDQSYWELLARVWIDCENVWRNLSGWKHLWSSGRPEKQFAMTIEEREMLAPLPDKLTIYRGSHDHNVNGLSWTLSREKAIWFARRFHGAVLTTATANKQDVHALLNGRREQEIVVGKFLIKSREPVPNVPKDKC